MSAERKPQRRAERASAQERGAQGDDTPILEWIAGGVGLILFLAAITITLANSFTAEEPPVLTVEAEAPVSIAGRFRVEFEVVNSGDQTASGILIEATLRANSEILEAHDVTLDFLPPHSRARAGLFLANDPRGADFDITVASYHHP